MLDRQRERTDVPIETAMRIYLLGQVDFETALGFQRRLVYEISGNRSGAALILCEHPSIITVGRHGSWSHLCCDIGDHQTRPVPVRWVNRGGGCVLHAPGQLGIYPILALDYHRLGIHQYLEHLRAALVALLDDFSIQASIRPGHPGVCVAIRPIAEIGIAVRDWVTYFGAALNINPDLLQFNLVSSGIDGCEKMTSIERERHGPLRPGLVRERLIEHIRRELGFGQTILFPDHTSLKRKAPRDAIASLG
jgi:lipoyl(octanoyl) transferase